MAKHTFETESWQAPNFARLKGVEGKAIAVADLSPEALNEMAAEWLCDLYRKANKHSPWKNIG